jgi:hypothetical protein
MPLCSNLRSTCMRMPSCVCKPKPLNHKSIIVGENDSNNGISMYNLNYIVCFKYFLIVDVYCNNYRCLQRQKCIKLVAVIVYVRLKNEKLVLCENLVSLISLKSRYVLYWDGEFILSPIRMWPPLQSYRCLATDTLEVDDDPVALYLGYYDWSLLR